MCDKIMNLAAVCSVWTQMYTHGIGICVFVWWPYMYCFADTAELSRVCLHHGFPFPVYLSHFKDMHVAWMKKHHTEAVSSGDWLVDIQSTVHLTMLESSVLYVILMLQKRCTVYCMSLCLIQVCPWIMYTWPLSDEFEVIWSAVSSSWYSDAVWKHGSEEGMSSRQARMVSLTMQIYWCVACM